MRKSTKFSPEVRERAVRMVQEHRGEYLPVELFVYTVPQHADPRSVFVKMLKTPDAGQFSYFTAHPGITRGGHYHHNQALECAFIF